MTLAAQVTPDREGASVTSAGTVTRVDLQSGPSGREWAIVTIADGASAVPVLFFCPAWQGAAPVLAPGAAVTVAGRVIVRDGEALLSGTSAAPLPACGHPDGSDGGA